jgi:hypothetical protein
MLTPYTMIVAFMGIPTGLILARTRKYKWMYIGSYAILTIALFAMWQFTAGMPTGWYVLVTSFAAFGVGAMGTITTLVAQFAVPRRLLGVAVGAMFFFQMIGLVVAPSILGLVQTNAPDLESGLKMVFFMGGAALTIASVMILTIPEISMDAASHERGEPAMPEISAEA